MSIEVYKFLLVLLLTIAVLGFIMLRNKAASWERRYNSLVKVEEMYTEKVRVELFDLIEQVEDRNKRLINLDHEVKRLARANEDLRVAIAKQQEINSEG